MKMQAGAKKATAFRAARKIMLLRRGKPFAARIVAYALLRLQRRYRNGCYNILNRTAAA